MIKRFDKYGQYKKDIFEKLSFDFQPWKKILDIWCWDWIDAKIFYDVYDLDVYWIDIYKHSNIDTINWLKFQKLWVFDMNFPNEEFDYVFLHDVLHHVDEDNQSYEKHIKALSNIKRICKKWWYIIIVEWNRYNPLFYPHMVRMLWHNHFKQWYFHKIVWDVFTNISYKYFEAHYYPSKYLKLWKVYEKFMECFCPNKFLAYNVAIIKND